MLSFRFRKHKMQRYLQFVLLFCLFGFMLSKSIPEDKFSTYVEVDKHLLKRIRRQRENSGRRRDDRNGCKGRKFKDMEGNMYLNWIRMCK